MRKVAGGVELLDGERVHPARREFHQLPPSA
jgi:hypothetical protein